MTPLRFWCPKHWRGGFGERCTDCNPWSAAGGPRVTFTYAVKHGDPVAEVMALTKKIGAMADEWRFKAVLDAFKARGGK